MNKLLAFLIATMVSVVAQGQNTCATATLFIDNLCTFLSPPTAGPITRCYSFMVPTDTISFQFVSFVPLGTCTDAVEWYQLFDDQCNPLQIDSAGNFGGLTPGTSYRMCYNITCPTDGVVNLICTSETTSLPIELLYFTARSQNNGVQLLWSTASEHQSMGFVVRRSVDLANWRDTGFIEGAGNSTHNVDYQLLDTQPVVGVNYYMLVQIDLDGSRSDLQVIAVTWDPNLTKSNFPFRLYNFLGQKVGY